MNTAIVKAKAWDCQEYVYCNSHQPQLCVDCSIEERASQQLAGFKLLLCRVSEPMDNSVLSQQVY